jgi:hypothetical protein
MLYLDYERKFTFNPPPQYFNLKLEKCNGKKFKKKSATSKEYDKYFITRYEKSAKYIISLSLALPLSLEVKLINTSH